jgi:hypothetical protein
MSISVATASNQALEKDTTMPVNIARVRSAIVSQAAVDAHDFDHGLKGAYVWDGGAGLGKIIEVETNIDFQMRRLFKVKWFSEDVDVTISRKPLVSSSCFKGTPSKEELAKCIDSLAGWAPHAIQGDLPQAEAARDHICDVIVIDDDQEDNQSLASASTPDGATPPAQDSQGEQEQEQAPTSIEDVQGVIVKRLEVEAALKICHACHADPKKFKQEFEGLVEKLEGAFFLYGKPSRWGVVKEVIVEEGTHKIELLTAIVPRLRDESLKEEETTVQVSDMRNLDSRSSKYSLKKYNLKNLSPDRLKAAKGSSESIAAMIKEAAKPPSETVTPLCRSMFEIVTSRNTGRRKSPKRKPGQTSRRRMQPRTLHEHTGGSVPLPRSSEQQPPSSAEAAEQQPPAAAEAVEEQPHSAIEEAAEEQQPPPSAEAVEEQPHSAIEEAAEEQQPPPSAEAVEEQPHSAIEEAAEEQQPPPSAEAADKAVAHQDLACQQCKRPLSEQPDIPEGWSACCDDCCCGQCGSRRTWDTEYEMFYCCGEHIGGNIITVPRKTFYTCGEHVETAIEPARQIFYTCGEQIEGAAAAIEPSQPPTPVMAEAVAVAENPTQPTTTTPRRPAAPSKATNNNKRQLRSGVKTTRSGKKRRC